MASVPPYNYQAQVPPPPGQPNQGPPPPQPYSQSPHLQHQQYASPQQYVPDQQQNYQSPPPGHVQQPYQTHQPPPAQYAQSPQGPPQQYTPGQQPSYQQPPPGHHVNQLPQSPHVQHSQSPQGQYPPQPGQQPSYQSPPPPGHQPHQVNQPGQSPQAQHPQIPQGHYSPQHQQTPGQQPAPAYGVAAPPTPTQHQQQYQQQAAQFATRPSAQTQLQSTAQSLFKSGKGILGNLASNIKSKYPTTSNASPSSTVSYTGETPKPTYNPAQHPTQTPLSPTNSFPQGYGQSQSQSQPPQQAYPHQAPPTPQQSAPPAAPAYNIPTQHQPAQVGSPTHPQSPPGQPPHLSWEARLEAAQHPHPSLQQTPANGIPGAPGAVPQPPVQSPPAISLYPQQALHHQQSNPYQPTPPAPIPQSLPQGAAYAGSPGHGQSPPQVLSPQQQHQSPPPQLQQQASWPQQGALSTPYNPAVLSPMPQPGQPTPEAGAPGYGPPDGHQQPQYQQQAGITNPYEQTNLQQVPQPNQGGPAGVSQSPHQVLPQQQQPQNPLPQGHQQHQATSYSPMAASEAAPTAHPAPPPAVQTVPASYPQGLPATQSPHQHHQSPPSQQPTSATPVSQTEPSSYPGAPVPPGQPYPPYQPLGPQTGGAPGVAQPIPTPGQAENYQPLPLQNQANPVAPTPAPAPTANQFQAYNPLAGEQAPQAQYGQPPHQATTSPPNSQHYSSPPPPPTQGYHRDSMYAGQPFGSTPTAPEAAGQNFQPYQPAPPPTNPQLAEPIAHNNPSQNAPYGNQQDTVASLSAQMSNLNVLNNGQPPAVPGTGPAPGQDGPRGPIPCQATGMASDTLPYCPEGRTVSYSLDWYRFIAVPQYLICTKCYADHVAGTHLAAHFERYHSPEGTESRCGFWSPRAREFLWPQALQTNDIGPLRAFIEKSLTIQPCKGRNWTTGADGIKYWGMVNNDIRGFISCEACYEDYIAGTPFESHFKLSHQQGQDEKWMCDMCIPYIAKTAVKMSKQSNWNGFVGAAKVRFELPICEGRDEESNSGHWMIPRRKIKDMTVCEACYLDKIALTQFGNEFERHQRAEGFDAFLESIGQKWKCKLTGTAVNMSIALEAAIYRRDFDVFWNAANAICALVPCTIHGIVRGNWWTVAGGNPDFDVCEACYKGIVETSNLEKFFEPAQRDPTVDIVCNFCPGSPRWGEFITKFAEALDKGVFSYYSDYVKKWAGVQPCPGIKNRAKSKWWGHPEALACESCWMNFVTDTPLGESVPVKGVYDERTLICQLWSPRMRNMWLAACAAGPPGSPESQKALDEFRAFGTRRVQVYNATVPHIEMIQQMMLMKNMQAMQQGQLSLMYQGMNSMASLSGTTDGYMHGNSSIGYYETEHGVTAANMMNNMHAGMADANKSSDWMQIAQLQATWMEVE
ncbi:hypothetical protein F53441_6147 [Fusarium austroafricanum]|uniref:C2H2-type domain-containing protein n=1 Tax=Fusarium austroafricanum TaxID=2364996 RepID=A0A8H4KIL3_9HYPO|nr:hypothetical protein F53441_6147 [Fusarium austroafricanum]